VDAVCASCPHHQKNSMNNVMLSLIAALAGSLGSALVSLGAGERTWVLSRLAFPLLGLSGLASIYAGLQTLMGAPALTAEWPMGLPWMHWHLRLDSLSGFFLALIGTGTLAVSLYGPGYIREYRHSTYSLGVLGLATGLFVTGMQLVVLADDAFAFMVAWELMSLSSYFLVAFQHQNAANRRAAFIYLAMAQIGGLCVLLAFGVMAGFGGDFTFDAMRAAQLDTDWATITFALGLIGFGMKAGLVPIHIWLPDAHPVAPSHVSALMSGVMLKVAVYGFIRLVFDLIGNLNWGWGVALLIIASITALFGVLYALVQHDLKRLLAYHSIENIGIIFIGLALSIIFYGTGHPLLGALGLVAALYHTLNHMLFKSLLFLGAGSVLQGSREHDMERMGGLLARMPWTGLFFLIGCISISALPPFNGFVSEWLTFQTALQAASLNSGVLRALIPIAAAVLALTGALAATCFVKVYGVAFLGQPRSRRVRRAREATPGMVMAQGLLAGLCLLFGVLPTLTVAALDNISISLTASGLPSASANGWMWLTPISAQTASYGAPFVLLGILFALGGWLLVNRVLRPQGHAGMARGDTWDCGFGPPDARMQYTASAFAQPIRRIFAPVWRLHETIERTPMSGLPLEPARIRHQLHAEDITWGWFYDPIVRFLHASVRRVGRIQTGHLRHYLAYSFITLILLLWVIT